MSFSRRRSQASREIEAQTEIQDETLLAQLGYKQELKRDWSLLHNFGVSFSIIVSIHRYPMLHLKLCLAESILHTCNWG